MPSEPTDRFAAARRIRALLPRTWSAFFERHGNVLPVQAAAIPEIVKGADILVSAPTAGGKTEAALAPILERALTEHWKAPAVLVVSPTRALVNDLYRRLEGSVARLDLTIGRRTADHRQSLAKGAPFVLVTTPESLDSILCRYQTVLKNVRALVLDEIHCLDGGARGDQTAILVTRLRRLVEREGARVQTVALSATVGDADDVASRYLDNGTVVRVAGQREIIVREARYGGLRSLRRAVDEAVQAFGAQKVLAFVNRRDDAEKYSVALRGLLPFGEAVFSHHGSLQKPVRESVERQFLDARSAVCVATMTLELGIDIGDVDLVILLSPPSDVQAFLQRIGRGNRRRRDETRVLFAYRNAGQQVFYEFLLASARRGELYPSRPTFRPAILAQQALSLLYQNPKRWVSAEALMARLPVWVRQRHGAADVEAVLRSLAQAKLLDAMPGHGMYARSDATEHLFETGKLHSNITDEAPGLEVVDSLTGVSLGKVTHIAEGDQKKVTVGGRTHDIVRESGDQIRVRVGAEGAGIPRFPPRGKPLVSFELAQAFRAHLGLEATDMPAFQVDGSTYLFHFAGSLAGMILAAWWSSLPGASKATARSLCVVFKDDGPSERVAPSRAQLSTVVGEHLRGLAKRLQSGPFTAHVPEPMLQRSVEEVIGLDRLVSFVALLQLAEPPSVALREVLFSLRML